MTSNEKWYRVATDHKLAIAVLGEDQGLNKDVRQIGTGFLIDGGSLHSELYGDTLFITAGHVISSFVGDRDMDPQHVDTRKKIRELSARFPSMSSNVELSFDELLFYSSDLDYSILTIEGDIPSYATTVTLNSENLKSNVYGIAVLHWTEAEGFVLGLGHVLGQPSDRQEPFPSELRYTHVTGPGASGAPVFSMETAELVCLHQRGSRNVDPPWAACTTFDQILADIASKTGKGK